MPLQNRVTPFGDIIAVSERGLFTGNRGILHTPDQQVVHYNRGRRWITCQLEFRGWHREVMQPNRWTELFFLDEATALAAGHRPCAMCRHRDYQRFRRYWAEGQGTTLGSAGEMDLQLHRERVSAPRRRRTFDTELSSLTEGVFILLDGDPWLLSKNELLHWTPGGYDHRRDRPEGGSVTLLTPRSTALAIAAGYVPVIHPSASFQREP